MKKLFIQSIQRFYHNPIYSIYFLFLIALIIVPSFSSLWSGGYLVFELFYVIVIILSIIYASNSIWDLIIMSLLGLIMMSVLIIYGPNAEKITFNPFVTAIFFGIVLIRIVQHVLEDRNLNINDIYALASGYLVLPVSATPYFYMLHNTLPLGIISGDDLSFIDIMYFCFMTSTSVGYGDIVPGHPVTRTSSIILAVFGQLYLSILVGLIIGKYISSPIKMLK